ncbi:thiosulfate sulfurtransferase [Luminiphilus syltensis NOR5-1B]|uniref:Thiosulfate sulfurtransferase n=1 Tax=Luminiphilus syltensis NOR5-1B TaxID=565045 RepID=B8KWQ5_9GAMM|nr:thiosulfate sulfurtransferase GlpE [Luminiphilus syltensis]EED35826.1 thiosulfate sulfurtransferase [Luminiphilus syltensis NOR5-1B]
MANFQHLSVSELVTRLETGSVRLVDIRDPHAYAAGRIPAATLLDSESAPDFIAQTPPTQPIVVCCYHGISSQSAAAFLASQGFETVYSLDGGFCAWEDTYPERIERG